MGTYNLDQYQKVWRARAKELKRAAKKTTSTSAMFMRNTARGFAPIKTTKLRQGINARPSTSGGNSNAWEVSSIVPGAFPYNLWVNKSAGYKTLTFKSKGGWIPPSKSTTGNWVRVFAPNTSVVYGDGSHINTGTPGYWTQAKIQTSRFFGNLARKNVRNVFRDLKVSIT